MLNYVQESTSGIQARESAPKSAGSDQYSVHMETSRNNVQIGSCKLYHILNYVQESTSGIQTIQTCELTSKSPGLTSILCIWNPLEIMFKLVHVSFIIC